MEETEEILDEKRGKKRHHKKKAKKKGKTDGKSAKSKGYTLRDWFDEGGWVQAGGKYDGKPCAKQPGQKTKPFCRDPDDRAKMSKKERESRAKKKRKEDPNPNRKGKAKNVTAKNKKKSKKNEDVFRLSNEEIRTIISEELEKVLDEKRGKKRHHKKKAKKKAKRDACYHKVKRRYKIWPSAYASGALTRCRKVGAKNWGNKSKKKKKSKKNESISESLQYHLDHGVGVDKNVFRPGSSEFFNVFREARQLFREGVYKIHSENEKEIIESDLGEFGMFGEQMVPLDFPMLIEQDEDELLDEKKRRKKKKKKDPPLNKPTKNTGGGKKYKVYVRSKSGGVKKITYGDAKGGLKGNWNNAEARTNFAKRHKCADKKDRTKAGYWACRAHKHFGKNVPGRFW